MKIRVSKLIANKANALKITPPFRRWQKSACDWSYNHGLNVLLISGESTLSKDSSPVAAEVIRLACSEYQADTLVTTLQLGGSDIDARHSVSQGLPESKNRKKNPGGWLLPEMGEKNLSN